MNSPERKPSLLAGESAVLSVGEEQTGRASRRDLLLAAGTIGFPRPRSADAWFTPRRFAVILLLLLFAAYPDVMLGSHTFFYRDYGCFGYPLAHFHRESFWRGEVPLWNPLNNCGVPFLAQWNTMTLYPLSSIYLLLPLPWSLGFFCLGHLFLGGLGMFIVAERWTQNRFAASFAGLAYGLNGLMLHALMWPNNIAALGWMPWVVLLAERAWREGGRNVLLAAAAGALQMLTGAPEVILFTWLVVGAVWLSGARIGAGGWRLTLRSARVLTLVVALVVGLSAAQLFPFVDLLMHSHRDKNFGGSIWSMPVGGLINFLLPLFGCTPSVTGVFSRNEQQWTSSYYVGVVVVALAILAVLRCRERRTRTLAIIVALGLVLSLGDQGVVLVWLKKLLPALGFIRFPIKFVMLAVFALPLLAACTLSWWQRMPGVSLEKQQRWLGGIGIALFLLMGAIVLWAAIDLRADEFAARRTLNGIVRGALLALSLACILSLRQVISPVAALLLRLGILGLVAVDLLTQAPLQNPTVMTDAYRSEAVQRHWSLKAGEGRALVSPRMRAFMDYAANPNAYNFCVGQRRALTPNWNVIDGVPTVGGFYSLYTREQHDVWSLFYSSTNYLLSLADFLGVARVSSDIELFAWVERPSARPLVTAGQQPVFADESTTLRAMQSSSFAAERIVYLPESALGIVLATNPTSARVFSARWRSHELKVEVEAEQPSIVTVAHTHYHWWKATVNGQPTRVWPANHAFQAVEVPAGRSTVKLIYDDRSFFCGAVVSMAMLLTCTWLWFKLPDRARVEAQPGVMP